MRNPRIKKITSDLWTDRARGILVFLAIAVGALGVGTVMDARAILAREMAANYRKTNPASAVLSTTGLSQADLSAVRCLPRRKGGRSVRRIHRADQA